MEELFTKSDLHFLESVLNKNWHNCNTQVERKDLGDIERKMYVEERKKSKELMDKVEVMLYKQGHI